MTSPSSAHQNLANQHPLTNIRIVLVAPAGPLNIGSVTRVMKNFGLTRLVLVNPQCDHLGEEARQMAVKASDVLAAATVVDTVPEALVGCTRAIATTARARGFNAPLELPEDNFPKLFNAGLLAETALVFGPEDRGLSNEELAYAQQFIKVATDDGYPSLNLAQAVAVCCYELSRAQRRAASTARSAPEKPELMGAPPLRNSPLSAKQSESTDKKPTLNNAEVVAQPNTDQPKTAQLNELEGYYQHLESVLLQVEYLYPHTAASRMRKFRQLLHRAAPSTNEVALLRGMLRQVEWALSDSKKG